jgi:DNA-binding NarL/FixJ family response regulator
VLRVATVRAVVLDEWPMIRVGVTKVLGDADVRVVADVADATSAMASLRTHRPDLLVVGPHDSVQADLVARALLAVPGMRCIALVSSPGPTDVRPVLTAGAHGVVARGVDPDELRDVLRRVMAGERVVSPGLLPRLFDRNGHETAAGRSPIPVDPATDQAEQDAPAPALTGREREIMRLLGAGRSNAEIATALFVSSATVKTHLAHIYGKLGVRGRYEAVGRAVALGLLN